MIEVTAVHTCTYTTFWHNLHVRRMYRTSTILVHSTFCGLQGPVRDPHLLEDLYDHAIAILKYRGSTILFSTHDRNRYRYYVRTVTDYERGIAHTFFTQVGIILIITMAWKNETTHNLYLFLYKYSTGTICLHIFDTLSFYLQRNY